MGIKTPRVRLSPRDQELEKLPGAKAPDPSERKRFKRRPNWSNPRQFDFRLLVSKCNPDGNAPKEQDYTIVSDCDWNYTYAGLNPDPRRVAKTCTGGGYCNGTRYIKHRYGDPQAFYEGKPTEYDI